MEQVTFSRAQAERKEQAGRSFSDRLLVEYLYLLLARTFQVTAEAEEQVKGKETIMSGDTTQHQNGHLERRK